LSCRADPIGPGVAATWQFTPAEFIGGRLGLLTLPLTEGRISHAPDHGIPLDAEH
jgi:hypothetical protein